MEATTSEPEIAESTAKKQVNDLWFRTAYTEKHRIHVNIWLETILKEIDDSTTISFSPSVLKMQEVLETNGVARMYVTQMLEQSKGKTRSGTFGRITSIKKLLTVINHIINRAPKFNPNPRLTGADTFPLSSLFTEMMATEAGESAFRNEAFNDTITGVLQEWCDYLDSEKSTYVLNEGENGWLSPLGQKYTDLDNFVVPNRNAPHFGFTSYNSFFHREIKPELRPISAPDDKKVIVSPNDGSVFQIASNIQKSTDFWAKGQTYSLINILNNSPYVNDFIGGDMVQTFLSGNDYHRFHAPIDGTILKTEIVQGLTFSQRNSEKEPGAGTESLGYEASVNTRGLVYIQSDDEVIGKVCVIPIGITEISSVRFGEHITEGAKVKKGDELGRFSYGGSTLCLLFQPNAIKNFVVQPVQKNQEDEQSQSMVLVNAQIATAR
ncbi:phosphatidylserine decarboxylase family protein [Aquimarina sediminis]|uniref:phosphatidylserine decarboxylase family protein n=1 Tax=Aquimarina sediminis TaxID=2070536 RepID=UPI000CA0838E|nr:phosphatidylserine decarboxylase family protein [Aquimarina sediminis]